MTKRPDVYVEEKVLDWYITHNLSSFMTDFERKAISVALRREKAAASDSPGVSKRLVQLANQESAEIIEASGTGYKALRQQLRNRVRRAVISGEIDVNRCPRCNRIVRTPVARQCLWCGHDWHNRRSEK